MLISVLPEDQVPPPVPVKVIEDPAQTVGGPDGMAGIGYTVTKMVAMQPLPAT